MKRIVLFSLMFLVFSISQAKTTNKDTYNGYVEAVTCEDSSKEITQYVSFYVPRIGFFDQDVPTDFIALASFEAHVALVGIKANVKNMTYNGSPIFTFIFDQNKIIFDTKTKKAISINDKNEESIIDCQFVLVRNLKNLRKL